MKAKIIVTAVLFMISGISHAGFECQEGAGSLRVTTEHVDSAFDSNWNLARLEIITAGKDEVKMSALVKKWNTRVGSRYAYQLPVDGISLSISESNNLISNPDCHPGGRITCDYDWSTTYAGYLTFNGKSYELSCKIL